MWAQLNYLEPREQYYSFCGFFSSLFLYFFVFSALGSASFSLDIHYKVNSNCTLGHTVVRLEDVHRQRPWVALWNVNYRATDSPTLAWLWCTPIDWMGWGGGGGVYWHLIVWIHFTLIKACLHVKPHILFKDRASHSYACYFFDVSLLTACSSISPPPPIYFFFELSSVPSVPSIWKGIVEQAWQRAAQRCGGKPSTAGRDSVLFAWKCVLE